MTVMARSFTVYQHINKINGKRYIGITCNTTSKRWKKGNGYNKQPKFYGAIQKYGWDGFEHIIVKDNLPEQCAKSMEKVLIKLYDTIVNGYNITEGGDGSVGVKRSEETRKRMSEGHKGLLKGIPHSEEHKQHLSDNSGKKKRLSKYTLDGKYIETFDSIKSAMNSVGGNPKHFTRDMKPDGTYKGYIWKYE